MRPADDLLLPMFWGGRARRLVGPAKPVLRPVQLARPATLQLCREARARQAVALLYYLRLAAPQKKRGCSVSAKSQGGGTGSGRGCPQP